MSPLAIDSVPDSVEHSFRVAEFDTVVVANDPVKAEYRLLVLDAPPMATRALPGQFFHLLCPQHSDPHPFFRRPMSVYRIEPREGRLSFLYKAAGRGTRAMATLLPGDRFNIFGPLGIGFSLPPAQRPIVILARGVGLATMAPFVPWARRQGHAVTAILSARSPEFLMSVEEMRQCGAEVITLTDVEGTSDVEMVESLLKQLHEQGRLGAIYVCGSNRLMLAAQRVARRFDSFGEVALEQQMACGLGMCFCCVRPFRRGEEVVYRRVCCEGPVFPLQDAISW